MTDLESRISGMDSDWPELRQGRDIWQITDQLSLGLAGQLNLVSGGVWGSNLLKGEERGVTTLHDKTSVHIHCSFPGNCYAH